MHKTIVSRDAGAATDSEDENTETERPSRGLPVFIDSQMTFGRLK